MITEISLTIFLILAALFIIVRYPEDKPKLWWIESIFNGLILGFILILFTFYLNSIINPLPEPIIGCFKTNNDNSTHFILTNPSRDIAIDYNLLIYGTWGGQSGFSFPGNELCSVGPHSTDRLTEIHCDYIPPKSDVIISILFENETRLNFVYDVWGETMKKLENQKIKCKEKL